MITKGNETAGAVFSNCEKYRYRLWRVWDTTKPKICFVMLNPSTADENQLDPTVSRCKKRAEMLGYGGFEVVNIFALRSTDPKGLYELFNPEGNDNNAAIYDAVQESEIAICAWGTHGKLEKRGASICSLLRCFFPKKIHYLKLNADGSPAHPLYLPYSLRPVLWSEE